MSGRIKEKNSSTESLRENTKDHREFLFYSVELTGRCRFSELHHTGAGKMQKGTDIIFSGNFVQNILR